MKVVLLCGGKGIRAFPFTEYLPKPMMPVGGSPILAHIIRSFIAQGHHEIVLAAGYRKSILDDYFEGKDIGAAVDIVDTGEESDTGERILRCRDRLDGTFMATYGDGLADVRLDRLIEFHHSHDGIATMTVVPMESQYGIVDRDEKTGRVLQLREKPMLPEHCINIGFFVFEPEVFDHWRGTNLESHVLPHLIEQGLLYCYRHDGFFKSMDSYKDQQDFEEVIDQGPLPWLVNAQVVHE